MSVETLSMVLNHSKATGSDKLVLIGIANHDGDGGAWPSIATLARYANMTERGVQKCISKLVELGELSIEVQQGGTHQTKVQYRPNRYEVLVRCPADCDGTQSHRTGVSSSSPLDSGVNSSSPLGVNPSSPLGVNPSSPEPSLEPPMEPSGNPPTPLIDAEVVDDLPVVAAAPAPQFSQVWIQWPRKVGKAAALKAWEKAAKAGEPAHILEALAIDAQAYATYPKTEVSLIPHLATWLNGRRWEDEERQRPWAPRNGTSLRAKVDAELVRSKEQADVFRRAQTPNDIIKVALRNKQMDNLEAAVRRGLDAGMSPDQMNAELRKWLKLPDPERGVVQ